MHESNLNHSQLFSGGMMAFPQSASIWDADAAAAKENSACNKSQNQGIGSSAPASLHQVMSYFSSARPGGPSVVVPSLSPPLMATTTQGQTQTPPPPPPDFQAQITLPSPEAVYARQASMESHAPVLVASTGQNTSAVVTNVVVYGAQELRTLIQAHDAPSRDLEQSQTMWQQPGPIAAPPVLVPVAVHVPALHVQQQGPQGMAAAPVSADARVAQGCKQDGDDPNNEAAAIDQLLGPDCDMDFMDTLFADDDDDDDEDKEQKSAAARVSPSFPSSSSPTPLEELFASEGLPQSERSLPQSNEGNASCDETQKTIAHCVPSILSDAKKKKASSAAPSAPVKSMRSKSASMEKKASSIQASVASCSSKPPPTRKRSVPCGGGVGVGRLNAVAALDPKTNKSTTPREYFDSLLSSRGYSTKVSSSLDCGYYHKPSPLQLASFGNSVIRAAEKNDASRLSALLRSGLSRNPCNRFLEGTLARSIKRGHTEAFQAQIEAGAKIHVVDDFGRTPLHYAAWAERTCFETVQALLDIDRKMLRVSDKRGMTPLDYLSSRNAQGWVEFFERKRDEYWPDKGEGWTEGEEEAVPRASAACGRGGTTMSDPEDALSLEVARSVAMGDVDPASLQADDDASTSSSASSVKLAAPPDEETLPKYALEAVEAKASPTSNKRKLDDTCSDQVRRVRLHATHRRTTASKA